MDFLMILLTTSLIMSVIMLALFLFSSLSSGQKLNAQTRYLMWVILLVGLAVPFRPLLGDGLIRLDRPIYEISPVSEEAEKVSQTDMNGSESKEVLNPRNRASSEESTGEISVLISKRFSLRTLLFAVWAAGALILFGKHILQYREFQRIIRRWGEPVSDPDVLEIFEWVKAKMGLEDKKIGLIRCSMISTPMLTGLVKPVVLLPEKPIADDEMELILEHELTHYKHKDLLINLIGIIALCLHWFNPLVYLCLPVIYGDGESYCDETVLKNKDADYRRFYGEVIISMIETSPQKQVAFSTCFYAKKINLKRRLLHIMESGKKRRKLSVSSVALIFALTLVSGSVIVFASPQAAKGGIDGDRAVRIALDEAGVSADSIALDGVELDRSGARPVYEVDFHDGSTEYSYKIDTVTGKVVRSEKEKEENERASLPSEETSSEAPVQKQAKDEKQVRTSQSLQSGEAGLAEGKQSAQPARKIKTSETQERESISSGRENKASEKTSAADSSKTQLTEEKEERKIEKTSSSNEGKTSETDKDKSKDDDEDDEDKDEEDEDPDDDDGDDHIDDN